MIEGARQPDLYSFMQHLPLPPPPTLYASFLGLHTITVHARTPIVEGCWPSTKYLRRGSACTINLLFAAYNNTDKFMIPRHTRCPADPAHSGNRALFRRKPCSPSAAHAQQALPPSPCSEGVRQNVNHCHTGRQARGQVLNGRLPLQVSSRAVGLRTRQWSVGCLVAAASR